MQEKNNFLTRLSSYSFNKQKLGRENFLTEVLAYLFETDAIFKRIFLRSILRDGRTRARFKTATAETQASYPRCFVDLLFRPKSGKPILIEVKIAATETQTKIWGEGTVPQVKKYIQLRRGPVAYLTSLHAQPADVRKQARFLGHFLFEDLHRRLAKAPNLTPIGKELVGFLEGHGMAHPKPFTAKELRFSKEAFDFAAKAQEHLDEVVSEYQLDFRRAIRTRSQFSRATFSTSNKSAYAYLKGFSKWPFQAAGFGIDPDTRGAWFSVWFKIKKDAGADIQVRKAKFYHEPHSLYWSEVTELKGGSSDRQRIHRCVENAIRKLKRYF